MSDEGAAPRADGPGADVTSAAPGDTVLNTDGDGFIYFSLEGERFEDEGMPASAAIEIKRLNQLVYEVARGLWLRDHPGRTRVDSDLVAAFDLRLMSIEAGSSQLRLRMTPATRGPDEDDFAPLFVRARDEVVTTLRDLVGARELPPTFPVSARPALKRLGASLKDDEQLAVAPPRTKDLVDRRVKPAEPVIINEVAREVLKSIDAALEAEPVGLELEGVIVEFDSSSQSFRLRDTQGVQHVCRLAYHEYAAAQAAKDALAPDGVTAPDVRVQGIGILTTDGRITTLHDVTDVQVVRTAVEKVLMSKLEAITALEPGWWGDGSSAPDADALAAARDLVPDLGRTDVYVAMSANGDGAVVLEWRRGDVECTAHLEPDRLMLLIADNVITDELDEEQTAFDRDRLLRFVNSGVLR